jgi:YggT family protein
MSLIQNALGLLINFLILLLVIDVILSWIYRGNNNLVKVIHIFTEPILLPGRKLQEKLLPNIPVDFSPIIAYAILRILEGIISTLG